MRSRGRALLVLAGMLVGLSGCDDETASADPNLPNGSDAGAADMAGDGGDLLDMSMGDGGQRDAANPPIPVVAIETRLNAVMTAAGGANLVNCVAVDPNGEAVEGHTLRVEVRPLTGWRRDADQPHLLTGEAAGDYQVTCVADGLGMRDETPVRWDVVPGPPTRALTELGSPIIEAGESTGVDCFAWDDYGNRVLADAVSIDVQPNAAGIFIEDGQVRVTSAGQYQVTCTLPGADGGPADLAVLPGEPARLVAGVSPVRPVHAVGQVITYAARVVDGFDNTVQDALLSWQADPPLPAFGEGRFRPVSEGVYTLSVQVENSDLMEQVDVLVDEGGPAIDCVDPPFGGMVGLGPRPLAGRVADLAGVERVTVDGQAVAIDADGRFSVPVDPAWGLNVYELEAEDAAGNVNSVLCAFFASDYLPENAPATDAIQLHMGQAAIDDGPGDQPILSLTDLLRRVLNSQGLVNAVVGAVQNPVLPNQCRARFIVCLVRLGANFEGLAVNGARTVNITLVNGGFRVQARLNNIDVIIRLLGTFSNRGTINVASLAFDMTFDVGLRNGRPDVRLRANSAAQVGSIRANFGGGFLSRTLLNLVFRAFEGTIRREVANTLNGFISQQADQVLQGALGGIDLASLSAPLEVPSIAGGPASTLSLVLELTTLQVNANRLLLGIGSRVNGPTRLAGATAGVPLPPGPRAAVLNPRGTAGVGISLVLVNQLLHRLWRAGSFEIADAGGLLDDLPEGARFGIQLLTPPALIGTGDGTVQMHLGPLVATVVYPGFFDAPLTLTVGAWVNADIDLVGGTDVSFSNLVVDDLVLSIGDADITAEARSALERELLRIVQSIVDTALAGALPSLPVPDFDLGNALGAFGVAPGTRLGLRNLSLTSSDSHFILDGTLRE